MTNRKYIDAIVAPNDAERLRGFVRNETAYYNLLVKSFGARMRTMPEIFNEITSERLIDAVNGRIDRKDRSIPERQHLLFEEIAAQRGALLASAREAMATEMLAAHAHLADSFQKANKPVELLSQHEPRSKRHVQIPFSAVTAVDKSTFRVPYAGAPITLKGVLPAVWRVMILRDPGGTGVWQTEFRAEPYVVSASDSPLRTNKPNNRSNRPARY